MKKLSERTHREGTTMLLYGESGTGKTFWTASAGDRTIIITDKNGIITLRSPLFKKTVGTDPFLEEIEPDESPTHPKVFDKIRNMVDAFLEPSVIDQWDTLVLDDVNTTRIGARHKAVDLNMSLGRSKTGANASSGKQKDIIIPTMADFGTEMGLVEMFLRELTEGVRSKNKNLIVCAHQRLYRKEGSNTIVATKPLFTGTDTPDAMPGIFDMVWYMRTVGAGSAVKREFVTENEGGILAKSRWGGLFKNPERDITAKQMFDRINKWQDEGKL